jgi:hypothetical protein
VIQLCAIGFTRYGKAIGLMAGGVPELVLISSLLLLCTRFHAANQLRSVPEVARA